MQSMMLIGMVLRSAAPETPDAAGSFTQRPSTRTSAFAAEIAQIHLRGSRNRWRSIEETSVVDARPTMLQLRRAEEPFVDREQRDGSNAARTD